jgi:hypothetical protein
VKERKPSFLVQETWHDMQSAVYGTAVFMYTNYYAKLLKGEDALTPFFKVRKVSQDPLENEFSIIRGGLGANTHPTTVQVSRHVGSSAQIKKFMKTTHVKGANSAAGKSAKRTSLNPDSQELLSHDVRRKKRKKTHATPAVATPACQKRKRTARD